MGSPDLTETELSAIHRLELGLEWLHSPHGSPVSFHHETGHAMDRLAATEERFRDSGPDELADALHDELLPRGVVPWADGDGRWTYEVLEAFEAWLSADAR